MDNLSFALQIAVVGFLVVIVTLLLLCFVMVLFNKFLAYQDKQAEESKSSKTGSSETAAAGAGAGQVESSVKGSDQGAGVSPEVVAASMGAVYYILETEGMSPYRISSVKPLGAFRSKWSDIARKSAVERRKDFVMSKRRRKLR